MAESKYGKNILRQTTKNTKMSAAIPTVLEGVKDWAGIQHRMNWQHITAPVLLQKESRSHNFDKFMCFLGADPKDSFDFGAEIELTMGKEAEKHVIDASTIICIPKGTAYGPLNFKKVTRPIIFCEISKGVD
jgi:hypothetical protein